MFGGIGTFLLRGLVTDSESPEESDGEPDGSGGSFCAKSLSGSGSVQSKGQLSFPTSFVFQLSFLPFLRLRKLLLLQN